MLGPSGFFLPTAAAEAEHDYNDMELIHTSKEGFNSLYRVCKNGRFFTYKALKDEYRGKTFYEDLLDKDFNIGFSLSHLNLCQYYAKIKHPVVGNCIVMEWIDGITLEELIKQGPIDQKLAHKIICEICDGLDYMHRKQIIHRDLKPENILITHNGQNVKIIDFGLSDADSYYTLKTPAGTRHYASPELLSGSPVDQKADLWSLGVIINEISSKYSYVSSRCMDKRLDKRFESAADVKEAILRNRFSLLRLTLILTTAVIVLALSGIIILNSYTPAPETEAPKQTETITPAAAVPTAVIPPADSSQTEANKPKPEKATTKKVDKTSTEKIKAKEVEELFNAASQSIL